MPNTDRMSMTITRLIDSYIDCLSVMDRAYLIAKIDALVEEVLALPNTSVLHQPCMTKLQGSKVAIIGNGLKTVIGEVPLHTHVFPKSFSKPDASGMVTNIGETVGGQALTEPEIQNILNRPRDIDPRSYFRLIVGEGGGYQPNQTVINPKPPGNE